MADPPSLDRPPDISLHGDEHVRRYIETDGEVGYIYNGAPILLLSYVGRRTGQVRTIPIIYTQVGDSSIVMASKGGAPQHPLWYLSLLENPEVTIQIKAKRFPAIARTAVSPEREALWERALVTWPRYALYQERASRTIPVVVLDPVPAADAG